MSEKEQVNLTRRNLLGGTAAAMAGLTIAPVIILVETAQAKPKDQPITAAVRWGILININNCADDCTGCDDERGGVERGVCRGFGKIRDRLVHHLQCGASCSGV